MSAPVELDVEIVQPAHAQPGDHIKLPGLGTWLVNSLSKDYLTLYLTPSWIPRPTPSDHASLSLKTGTLRTHHTNKKRLRR